MIKVEDGILKIELSGTLSYDNYGNGSFDEWLEIWESDHCVTLRREIVKDVEKIINEECQRLVEHHTIKAKVYIEIELPKEVKQCLKS